MAVPGLEEEATMTPLHLMTLNIQDISRLFQVLLSKDGPGSGPGWLPVWLAVISWATEIGMKMLHLQGRVARLAQVRTLRKVVRRALQGMRQRVSDRLDGADSCLCFDFIMSNGSISWIQTLR
jgi:hypothetical protein